MARRARAERCASACANHSDFGKRKVSSRILSLVRISRFSIRLCWPCWKPYRSCAATRIWAQPMKASPFCGSSEHTARFRMKRRTLKQLRSKLESLDHHNVYVVLLDPAVGKLRKVRAENPKRDPKKPCLYVGMTGLTPEERFANHKAGIKDASLVKRYGLRLLPELYEHLNPMPFEAAMQMEKDLAEDLRRVAYTVTGGH